MPNNLYAIRCHALCHKCAAVGLRVHNEPLDTWGQKLHPVCSAHGCTNCWLTRSGHNLVYRHNRWCAKPAYKPAKAVFPGSYPAEEEVLVLHVDNVDRVHFRTKPLGIDD